MGEIGKSQNPENQGHPECPQRELGSVGKRRNQHIV